MNEKIIKIKCYPQCGFVIQSCNREEIIEIIKHHAEKKHAMSIVHEHSRKIKIQNK